ncbi:MAG: biotin transporter BioY [Actinomycetia bacterium]|nr:biotin transporter BioY [Actinomycetes bacterium]
MSQAVAPQPRVLADLVPGARTRDVALTLGGTAFIAIFAQLIIPLPFTPVPITLSSFAVVMTGAALGAWRGGLSVLLYVAIGMAGAPVYGDGGSGWAFASFGYILAYVPAAIVAGRLAQRGHDQRPVHMFGIVALASAIVYVTGVPWLMGFTGFDFGEAMAKGVLPFLLGDTLKAIVIAGLLPSAWQLVGRFSRGLFTPATPHGSGAQRRVQGGHRR